MKYAGWQRVEKDAPMKPFLVVNDFSSRSHHHTKRATTATSNTTTTTTGAPFRLRCECERRRELRRAQRSRRESTGSITTTITTVATRTKITRQSLPPPLPPPLPPLPPQPHHRRRNRCPCGECFVRRELNTPGECSFHAKAAVAVIAAAPAIAITSGESSNQLLHQPLSPLPPPKLRQLRLTRRTSLSLWSWQSYYSWRSGSVTGGAEALPEGATAGDRRRAPGQYSQAEL